jgi:hypothetical protein
MFGCSRFRGVFGYKERPLHRAIMPPKPNGMSSWIKNSALIREIEHGSGLHLFLKPSLFGLDHVDTDLAELR